MTTQRTPTPWFVRDYGFGSLAIYGADEDTIVCTVTGSASNPEARADAEHIVRCVNERDSLLECIAAIEREVSFAPNDMTNQLANEHAVELLWNIAAIVKTARAALAKVTP